MQPFWKFKRGNPSVNPVTLDKLVFGVLLFTMFAGLPFESPKLRHIFLTPPYVLGTVAMVILLVAAVLSIKWAFYVLAVMKGLVFSSQTLFFAVSSLYPRLMPRGAKINGLSVFIDILEFAYVIWRLTTWREEPKPKALAAPTVA